MQLFSEKKCLVKAYSFTFMNVFGLTKTFCELKIPSFGDTTKIFLKENFRKKSNFKISVFCCFQLGKVVFESYAYPFGYFSALRNSYNFDKSVLYIFKKLRFFET